MTAGAQQGAPSPRKHSSSLILPHVSARRGGAGGRGGRKGPPLGPGQLGPRPRAACSRPFTASPEAPRFPSGAPRKVKGAPRGSACLVTDPGYGLASGHGGNQGQQPRPRAAPGEGHKRIPERSCGLWAKPQNQAAAGKLPRWCTNAAAKHQFIANPRREPAGRPPASARARRSGAGRRGRPGAGAAPGRRHARGNMALALSACKAIGSSASQSFSK